LKLPVLFRSITDSTLRVIRDMATQQNERPQLSGFLSSRKPSGVKGLHHAAYRCSNSVETRAFYEGFLGLPSECNARGVHHSLTHHPSSLPIQLSDSLLSSSSLPLFASPSLRRYVVTVVEALHIRLPSGEDVLHTFFQLDDGSCLAFFDAPSRSFDFKEQSDFDLVTDLARLWGVGGGQSAFRLGAGRMGRNGWLGWVGGGGEDREEGGLGGHTHTRTSTIL
jgi:catechol 2,3-dioxygenase-like lactoylglutathione lyase family enzyme